MTGVGPNTARVISSPFTRSNQVAPQQVVLPLRVRAQVRSWPALTEAAGAPRNTRTVPLDVELEPSCPRSFEPQQNKAPSARTAHVCVAPALICENGRVLGIWTITGPLVAKSAT